MGSGINDPAQVIVASGACVENPDCLTRITEFNRLQELLTFAYAELACEELLIPKT